jgi:hypothetical protein
MTESEGDRTFNPISGNLNNKYKTGTVLFVFLDRDQTPAGQELYDLQKNAQETHNVYGQPEYQAVRKKLKLELLRLEDDLPKPMLIYNLRSLILNQ